MFDCFLVYISQSSVKDLTVIIVRLVLTAERKVCTFIVTSSIYYLLLKVTKQMKHFKLRLLIARGIHRRSESTLHVSLEVAKIT